MEKGKKIEIPESFKRLKFSHFRKLIKLCGIKIKEFELKAGKYSGWVNSHAHKQIVPLVFLRAFVDHVNDDIPFVENLLNDILEHEADMRKKYEVNK